MNIRKTIQSALHASGRSQYRLAKESGVPQSTINEFLAGKSGLNSDSLERIFRVLGIRLELESNPAVLDIGKK